MWSGLSCIQLSYTHIQKSLLSWRHLGVDLCSSQTHTVSLDTFFPSKIYCSVTNADIPSVSQHAYGGCHRLNSCSSVESNTELSIRFYLVMCGVVFSYSVLYCDATGHRFSSQVTFTFHEGKCFMIGKQNLMQHVLMGKPGFLRFTG